MKNKLDKFRESTIRTVDIIFDYITDACERDDRIKQFVEMFIADDKYGEALRLLVWDITEGDFHGLEYQEHSMNIECFADLEYFITNYFDDDSAFIVVNDTDNDNTWDAKSDSDNGTQNPLVLIEAAKDNADFDEERENDFRKAETNLERRAVLNRKMVPSGKVAELLKQ